MSNELAEEWRRAIERWRSVIQSDWYKEQMYKFIGCKMEKCPLWREGRGCIADRCVLKGAKA